VRVDPAWGRDELTAGTHASVAHAEQGGGSEDGPRSEIREMGCPGGGVEGEEGVGRMGQCANLAQTADR
jgi:hypothetical protein